MVEVEVGVVSDFFSRPFVAAIELSGEIKQGDNIHIKGHTTDLEFIIHSIQIHNQEVNTARAGDSVGIKVAEKVRHGDRVYRVID